MEYDFTGAGGFGFSELVLGLFMLEAIGFTMTLSTSGGNTSVSVPAILIWTSSCLLSAAMGTATTNAQHINSKTSNQPEILKTRY